MTALDELGVKCNGCGRCCLELGGSMSGTIQDYGRWKAAGSKGREILDWAFVSKSGDDVSALALWRDPSTNSEWVGPCPWVREMLDGSYQCSIYALRPDGCRTFPFIWEQVEEQCLPGGLVVELDLE